MEYTIFYGNHQKCYLYVTPKGDSLYGLFMEYSIFQGNLLG
jgi:hypothetical protein